MQKYTLNLEEVKEFPVVTNLPKVPVLSKIKKAITSIDNFFFCEEDADVKPYFYFAISFGLLITLLVLFL